MKVGRKALITGITGQDGSYLAELLLDKGWEVHGIMRRSSSFNTGRIDHIFDKLKLHYGDMTDGLSVYDIVNRVRPNHIYNLAAQSHVKVSFETPDYTARADGIGTLNILEAMRLIPLDLHPKLYQACTSEMYGSSPGPQDEHTAFHPVSPYGAAKLYAYWMCQTYRSAYNLNISCGILFNHESPRRGETFVTRKITKAVARIATGKQEMVTVGNLDARRDWGHAKDYVEAMFLMMQQKIGGNYVIATGESHTVREMITHAFHCAGITITWSGRHEHERGYDAAGKLRVMIDDKYYRPNEVDFLEGVARKAVFDLKWEPAYSFHDLIAEMVDYDLVEEGKSS